MMEKIKQLLNEEKNQTGYVKRFIGYGLDWYIGSALSSIPLILLYMSLHSDATVIPQTLVIFEYPYNIIAGIMSLTVSFFYYVIVPIMIWPGQTLGKKLLHLQIVNQYYEPASMKQLIIRQFVMILLVEGSIYTASSMLHQLITVITGYNISSLYNYVGIGISFLSALLVLILKSKKSLHDIVAQTLVIDTRTNQYIVNYKKNQKIKRKQLKLVKN